MTFDGLLNIITHTTNSNFLYIRQCPLVTVYIRLNMYIKMTKSISLKQIFDTIYYVSINCMRDVMMHRAESGAGANSGGKLSIRRRRKGPRQE